MSSSETSTFLRAYVKYVRDFPTSVTFLLDKWPISKWYLIDCPSRILLLFLTRTSLVHFVLLFVILIVDLFLSRCLLYFFFFVLRRHHQFLLLGGLFSHSATTLVDYFHQLYTIYKWAYPDTWRCTYLRV